jgi:hypothetical protein
MDRRGQVMANADQALGAAPGHDFFWKSAAVLGPPARRILIGIFLILAFTATGAVLLFVLTAEQLQNSIAAPDLSQTKSTIGAIRQDVATVEYYYDQSKANSDALADAEKTLSKALTNRQGDLAAMTSAADDTSAFINQNDQYYIRPPLKLRPFTAVLDKPGPAPVAPGTTQTPNAAQNAFDQAQILDFEGAVPGYLGSYYAELDAADATPETATARKDLNDFKGLIYKTFNIYLQAHSAFDSNNSNVQALRAQIADIEAKNAGLLNELAPKGSSLSNDAYWNLCEDFYSFKQLVGESAYNIVLLPKMMLVLTLAIFMGILGSLIYISQDFLRDPDGRGFWDILFRIGLGAGVAFALFFFAAAGMLAMTQSSGGGGNAQQNMSPYLISFLGITGGYLSDRVTQWMREVGENTFKVNPGGPPPRWALGLGDALKAAGLSGPALASAIGATGDEVECWIAMTKPVPGDKQALVSAFLRTHPSKLFTDIQPG